MSISAPPLPGPAIKTPRPGAGPLGLLWLTWRQHRWTIIAGTALTGSLILWMLRTYSQISTLVHQCGDTACAEGTYQAQQLSSSYGPVSQAQYAMSVLIFLPVIFGLFWGAPLLAREHEQRTLGLAWTQDVSPTRWLVGKFAILAALVVGLTAAACLASNTLAQLIHTGTGDSLFEGTYFQATGWLPLTLALAWFAFGTAAGALTRRTTTALAITLGAFIGRQLLMQHLRPDFLAPLTAVRSFDPGASAPDALAPGTNALVAARTDSFVSTSGQHYSADTVLRDWCPMPPGRGASDPLAACLNSHHIAGVEISYQPGSRLELFHLIENGGSLAIAVLCILVAWLAVRTARVTN